MVNGQKREKLKIGVGRKLKKQFLVNGAQANMELAMYTRG